MSVNIPPVKDRVLVALAPFRGHQDSIEAPPETTQDGLAQGAFAQRPHVSMALRDLKDDGLVSERLAHVQGKPRRVKAYTLTAKGYHQARQIHQSMALLEVGYRGDKTTLGEIAELNRWGILDTLRTIKDGKPVDENSSANANSGNIRNDVRNKGDQLSLHNQTTVASPLPQRYYPVPSYHGTLPSPGPQPTQPYPMGYSYYQNLSFATPRDIQSGKQNFVMGWGLLVSAFLGIFGAFWIGEPLCFIASLILFIVSILVFSDSLGYLWYVKDLMRNISIILIITISAFLVFLIGIGEDSVPGMADILVWLAVVITLFASLGLFKDWNRETRATAGYILGTVMVAAPLPAALMGLHPLTMGLSWTLVGMGVLHLGEVLNDGMFHRDRPLMMGLGTSLAVTGALALAAMGGDALEPPVFKTALAGAWIALGIGIIVSVMGKPAFDILNTLKRTVPFHAAAALFVFGLYLFSIGKVMESGVECAIALMVGGMGIPGLRDHDHIGFALAIALVLLEAITALLLLFG